jgi:tRNA nucleotidyltransferase (CCA-adding enzyme)
MDLLDAYLARPIANGNEIRDALGSPKSGPWMKKAVEMVAEWQFRNPSGSAEGALDEVKARKSELGI